MKKLNPNNAGSQEPMLKKYDELVQQVKNLQPGQTLSIIIEDDDADKLRHYVRSKLVKQIP